MAGVTLHSGSFMDRDDNTISVTFYKKVNLNVSMESIDFGPSGGSVLIDVWSTSGNATLSESSPFITISQVSRELISGTSYYKYTYRVTCTSNGTVLPRQASLTASVNGASKTITVTQAQGRPTPQTGTYYYTVKVVDRITGYAIEGAVVQIYSSTTGSSSGSATTGLDGIAFLGTASSSSSRKYVTVSASGYTASTTRTAIYPSEVVDGFTTITLTSRPARVILYMNVKVQTEAGVAIPGAEVKFYDRLNALKSTETTDSAGKVSYMTGLSSPAIYTMNITANGYTTQTNVPITTTEYSGTAFTDSDYTVVSMVAASATPYYVNVKVTNSSGTAISGATVNVYQTSSAATATYSGVTNSSGQVNIQTGSSSGTYYVEASASGYQAMASRQQVTSVKGTSSYTNIRLAQEVQRNYYYNIKITDANGSAVNGATVELMSSSGATTAVDTATLEGNTYSYGVQATSTPGNYYVTISKSGYTTRENVSVTPTTISDSYSTIILSAQSTTTYYYTSVQVKDAQGNPISGAYVTVYETVDGTALQLKTTDSEGKMQLKATWTTDNSKMYVDVEADGYTSISKRQVTISTDSTYYNQIAMAAEDTPVVETTYYYNATVKDSDGTVVPGAAVRLYESMSPSVTAAVTYGTADSQGKYSYSVTSATEPATLYGAAVDDGHFIGVRTAITPTTSASTYETVLVLGASLTTDYTYTIKVKNASGENLGTYYSIFDVATGGTPIATGGSMPSANGFTYTYSSAQADPTLYVTVTKSGYETSERTAVPANGEVTIVLVETVVESDYYYNVKVVDGDGNTVSGATVTVYSDSAGTAQVTTGTTDSSGVYTYTVSATERPNSLYTKAWKNGYQSSSTKLTIPRTVTTTYTTLTMPEYHTYNFNIYVTYNGQPVQGATVTMYQDDTSFTQLDQETTGSNGIATLTSTALTAPEYYITAYKEGFDGASGYVTGTLDNTTTQFMLQDMPEPESEYVAYIDTDYCAGCGNCYNECQYGAIYQGDDSLYHVIPENCQGCGACCAPGLCPMDAITLIERQ